LILRPFKKKYKLSIYVAYRTNHCKALLYYDHRTRLFKASLRSNLVFLKNYFRLMELLLFPLSFSNLAVISDSLRSDVLFDSKRRRRIAVDLSPVFVFYISRFATIDGRRAGTYSDNSRFFQCTPVCLENNTPRNGRFTSYHIISVRSPGCSLIVLPGGSSPRPPFSRFARRAAIANLTGYNHTKARAKRATGGLGALQENLTCATVFVLGGGENID
jgi:hypothetical protein